MNLIIKRRLLKKMRKSPWEEGVQMASGRNSSTYRDWGRNRSLPASRDVLGQKGKFIGGSGDNRPPGREEKGRYDLLVTLQGEGKRLEQKKKNDGERMASYAR